MSNTPIPPKIQRALWALSAGRCAFCNEILIGDLLSGKAAAIFGYVAHIIADSPGGARGDTELSKVLAKDVANLMLLCARHHRLVDDEAPEQYPADALRKMKLDHEHRIKMVTGVGQDRDSHVIRFGANIGQNEALVATRQLHEAMLPDRWPVSTTTIDLEMVGCAFHDDEPEFWKFQQENLQRQYRQQIVGRIERQEIRHASVFALAPQPLLVELGRQLSDILPASVHQRHREPSTWSWQNDGPSVDFPVSEPEVTHPLIALVFSVSATITDDRIHRVLGPDCSIWKINANEVGNDIIRSQETLSKFRETVRKLLNRIKTVHGEDAVINVFPALPASAAVELGRVWMPKADLPMMMYDQNRRIGGFIPTIEIRHQ